jgi:pimeloyl-ACP methyl ester carboxylesterase
MPKAENVSLQPMVKESFVTTNEQVPVTLEYPIGTDKEVIVLAPGWCEAQVGLSGLRKQLAHAGYPAATIHHPRGARSQFWKAAEQRVRNIQDTEHELADRFGFNNALLVGHSLGGIDVVEAAERVGGELRGVVVTASAGLIAGDTPLQVAQRLAVHVARSEGKNLVEHPIEELHLVADALKTLMRHPLATAVEGLHAGSFDMRTKFESLGQQGLRMGRLQFAGDEVFSLSKVTESMRDVGHHVVHILENKQAGHNATAHNPQEVAQAVQDFDEAFSRF